MKSYVLSFRRWSNDTIALLQQLGLEPYVNPWGTRLCADVREDDRERIEMYFPKWSDIIVNQSE